MLIHTHSRADKEIYDKANPGAPISSVHHSKTVGADWKKLSEEEKKVCYAT